MKPEFDVSLEAKIFTNVNPRVNEEVVVFVFKLANEMSPGAIGVVAELPNLKPDPPKIKIKAIMKQLF